MAVTGAMRTMRRRMRASKARAVAVAVVGVAMAQAAVAADWDAGGAAPWQALLAKARQEGGLVMTLGTCPVLAELAQAFKRDTGIEATVVVGPGATVDSRYRLELQSGRLTIDVRLTGATDLDLAKSGALTELNDLLVLPDAANPANWRGGALAFVDNARRYMVSPSEYVTTRPLINTAQVDSAKLRSADDLLRPEFKGKIAAFDPGVPGAGQGMAAYLAHIKGIAFARSVYLGQEVVLTRDQRQLAEWVARGTYPIALGADVSEVQNFRREGVSTLVTVELSDAPGSLAGFCAVASIPKGAPHPASAAVFLNWYLSQNGQRALVRAARIPSLRIDVPAEGVPADILVKPGAAYLNQYGEDWYLSVRPTLQADLRKALDK
ncbi:MAG: extracellular solute-binding protein [Bauldia sp.]